MSNEMIWAGLTEIFREVMDNDDLELQPELTASDVDGWDSFRTILIVAAAEERFDIKLTSREIEALPNVGALADLIGRKLS